MILIRWLGLIRQFEDQEVRVSPRSAATIVREFPNVQHEAPESQVKLASSSRVSRFHTFRLLSEEAETARRPSGLIATPVTEPE
jgi:hypothetical protein